MTDRAAQAADEIRAMAVRGAEAVARHAVHALCEVAEAGGDAGVAAATLAQARPTTASLHNAVRGVARRLAQGAAPAETARRFDAWSRSAQGRIATDAAQALGDDAVVLTHCHSSTVVEALALARPRTWCTETRPFRQGRTTAQELVARDVATTFVVDAAVERVLATCGITHVLVGADAVGRDGTLVNKVGTMALARAAHAHGIPVWSLTTTLKVQGAAGAVPIEERPPDEVWQDPPPGVGIWNPVFDAVPPGFVDAYWTERGRCAPVQVHALPPWEAEM